MLEIFEKLIETDFRDTFKPASEGDLLKRIEGMNEGDLAEALEELLYEQGDEKQWELATEAGGDPSNYCVEEIMGNMYGIEDMIELYKELLQKGL